MTPGTCSLIGMIHIPISNILTGKTSFNTPDELPALQSSDLNVWLELNRLFDELASSLQIPEYADEFPGVIACGQLEEINTAIKRLSFIEYLKERMLAEVETYARLGINTLLFENVGAPYTARNQVPAIEALVMNHLIGITRRRCPELSLGIQMLAHADNIALEIAVRNGCQFIRGESFLFHGLRPDASNPTSGTLKKACIMRQVLGLMNRIPQDKLPRIYVDLMKKHTLFEPELVNLQPWLDNIDFCKLEGVVITGHHTGAPVDPDRMRLTRNHIDAFLRDASSSTGTLPLIAGSGVTPDNVNTYKMYFDHIIAGSSVKEGGYWENRIDEQRLAQLIEALNH